MRPNFNNYEEYEQYQKSESVRRFFVYFGILVLCLCFWALVFIGISPKAHSQEFSNAAYVQAIYLAEGGSNAQYPFGIRSASCSSFQACEKICTTTVRRNKRRFKEFGYKRYSRFIQFLGSRFCPTTGRNLSQSEQRLNKNWIKNVEYFLNHPTKRSI